MSEIENKLDVASNTYTENTVLRALVNGIPYIGGSLDVILASKGQEIIQKRVTHFLEGLKEQLQDIKETSINKEFLESEDFFDLIMKCITLAIKTNRVEKIHLFINLVRDAITIKKQDDIDNDILISIIDYLTPQDIEFLKRLSHLDYKDYRIKGELPPLHKAVDQILGLSLGEKDFETNRLLTTRLENTGLLHRKTIGTMGNYSYRYFPTRYCFKLLEFLKTEDINTK